MKRNTILILAPPERAKRRLVCVMCTLLLLLSYAAPARAQYQITSGAFNDISPLLVEPEGDPVTRPAIAGQNQGPNELSVGDTNSSSNAISDATDLVSRFPSQIYRDTSGLPTGVAIVLQQVEVGYSFASGVPRYFLGDLISPPLTQGDSITPADDGYWRALPVKPGEQFSHLSGIPLLETPVSAGSVVSYYYSPHAQRVFASQPGVVEITWVSRARHGGRFQFRKELFSVATSTQLPVKQLFWTDRSFNGPAVDLGARVKVVNPIFNPFFPERVAEDYAQRFATQPLIGPELRTLWFDNSNFARSLHAYNFEGRVFIEYLGNANPDGVTYEFLGADVVEVSQTAPVQTLTVELGRELTPPPAVSPEEQNEMIARPTNAADTSGLYASHTRPDGSLVYYAERENQNPERVQFYWLQKQDAAMFLGNTGPGLAIPWPKHFCQYRQVWPQTPEGYAQLVVPNGGSTVANGVFFQEGNLPQIVWQDDGFLAETAVDATSQRLTAKPGPDGANRSLLKFISGNEVWYVRVNTTAEGNVISGTRDGTSFTSTAKVGERIERPSTDYEVAGYIAQGTGYHAGAYRNPYASTVEAAKVGSIIPVNAIPGNDQLKVWWFKKVNPPSDKFPPFYVASRVGTYRVSYPADARKIILASNEGSGDLGPSEVAGNLYIQNNPGLSGYNPNEEHALLLAGRIYALRDDLNITSGTDYSSEPYALLSYTSAEDNRPSMRVFKIEREDDANKFDYPVTAGTVLQGPMPIPLLPLPFDGDGQTSNIEVTPSGIDDSPSRASEVPVSLYDKFTYIDRKGYHWVYRGPHAGAGTQRLEFKFFYPMQPGFYFPGRTTQPAVGTVLPYLRPLASNVPVGDAVTGQPIIVKYQPQWPACPELRVAESLSLPKFGLPAVRGQTSAEVLYQQSIANEGPTKVSTTLHDPTRQKEVSLVDVGLNELPSSAATSGSFGKIYFQLLPPHLQKRFFYDPLLGTRGSLVFQGEFVNEIAGEDYLQLNVLSAADVDAIKRVVADNDLDKAKWNTAVDALKTKVETFIENQNRRGTYIPDPAKTEIVDGMHLAAIKDSDTAVDSYALTATGDATGYVTLLFGDGDAFTPSGEPVSVKIIKVVPQLYTGDLKVLLSGNPLDEQVSLRHSGDFAARPQDFEFDWRYAPPGDGVAPATYLYQMREFMGVNTSVATNAWKLMRNPNDALGTPTSASTNISLPNSNLVIRDSAYSVGSNLPGVVLTNSAKVDFTSGVPEQLVLSAELPALDGFVLYVNGIAALANHAPATFENTDSTAGLAQDGLTRQWNVNPNFFSKGLNTISIALYTSADAGASSIIDFRLHGSVETDQVVLGAPWLAAGDLGNTAVVGGGAATLGTPLLAMSDNYFTMRYRAKTGVVAGQWSRWMPAKLVEGWIKRVLAGINPFNQRITDLLNNPVNTDVSLLTQAGTRWEGDVPLSLANINDFGLIEIYETVLKRGKGMSIDAGYDYAPANDALLLAAGYLNDLYNILGNEAFADAANPTISIDDQSTITEVNTSRFAFEGQVSSVLEEELGLLRGRDDFLNPGVQVAPAYNRLYWNYTRGINSGEALYAVNYNIKEKAGSPTADGILNAADAQRMFPQAHGDAYGHYLTALKGYYYLLSNVNFTWTPRSEAVTVLGQAVQIDYFDERKFARTAANVARAAEQTIALTHRQSYKDDANAGWAHFRDGKYNPRTNVTRRQGLDEWTSRSTQGAYINWIMGNSLLPEKDANPNHTGVQIIDRTTVPELDELASIVDRFQTTIDNANAHLNPLGLSPDAVAFDISPSKLMTGESHFDQVYDRALKAVLNAKGAFNQAAKMTRLLRNQENQVDDYNAAIVDQERDFSDRLQDIFGSPYSGDIGPGRVYAQNYSGPDLVNWFVVDRATGLVETSKVTTFNVDLPVNLSAFTGVPLTDVLYNEQFSTTKVPVNIVPNRFIQFSDIYRTGGMGQRVITGRLQQALQDSYQAQLDLMKAASDVQTLNLRRKREAKLFYEMVKTHSETLTNTASANRKLEEIKRAIGALTTSWGVFDATAELVDDLTDAILEGDEDTEAGTVIGFKPAKWKKAVVKATGSKIAFGLQLTGALSRGIAAINEAVMLERQNALAEKLTALGFGLEQQQAAYEYELLINEVASKYQDIAQLAQTYQRTHEQVRNVLSEGQSVLDDREVFRKRAAAIVQGYRTKDLTFRTFRNEALEQYRTLFDLAGRYTYLATKSYDYETGLLGSPAGQTVLSNIVASRSLGDLTDNIPQATVSSLGDMGLAGTMAQLRADWSVAKGRLGINNPDTYGTLFSLRGEAFRILNSPTSTKDDSEWRQLLEQHIVRDVMADTDAATHCAGLAKSDGSATPGIILPFSTTIEQLKNFFGLPLGQGDHTFTSSSFATKIYSVGMCFPGYVGMDPLINGIPSGGPVNTTSPLGLSATPYVYLIPCGTDTMRAPALGDTGIIRRFDVKDQALPLPFNLGASDFSSTQFFTAQGTLTEQPWIIRKHQAFRVVADPQLFYSRMPDEFTSRRLIGRSAWNTQWKLVIPAYTLLSNEQEGLNRFVASVRDIQLFLRTYSHAGN